MTKATGPSSEVELCQHFIEYFRDWEVYKEVPMRGGRTDIVVKAAGLIVAVEAKLQLNFSVLHQAMDNRPHSNMSYIAVPYRKGIDHEKLDVCRELGIGVLVYDGDGTHCGHWRWWRKHEDEGPAVIREVVPPQYRRRISPPRLHPKMKESVAGAQHNSMSDFRVTVLTIAEELTSNGGSMSLNEVFREKRYHYFSTRSARQCIVRMVNQGVIPEFRIENKQLILNDV